MVMISFGEGVASGKNENNRSRRMVHDGGANENQLPESGQGVVTGEFTLIHPVSMERRNARCRFELVMRVYHAAARSKALMIGLRNVVYV